MKVNDAKKPKHALVYSSPIGDLLLLANEDFLLYSASPPSHFSQEELVFSLNKPLEEARKWLDAYFNGRFNEATTPRLFQKTTVFRQKVYEALLKIPVGKTFSYKEIAKKISHPNAQRAVGSACAANQLPLFIPCHRALGEKNKLLYTLGGPENKKFLLTLEKAL